MRRIFAPVITHAMAATAIRCASVSGALKNELSGEQARDDRPTEPTLPSGWTIQHTPGNQVFTLSKSYNNEKITIESSLYNEAVNAQGEAENVGSMELTIQSNNEALVCALDVEDSELVLDSIMHVSDYGKYHKLTSDEQSKLYGGPEISELDQEVVGNFVGYLEERGINDDIAKYVLDYSVFREQQEYESWLSKVAEFTK